MCDMSYSNMSRSDLMRKIQELDFAVVDLNLFLDNHPKNSDAIKCFNEISDQSQKLKKIYEMKFGPFTNFGYGKSNCPWQWIDEPWPWENK